MGKKTKSEKTAVKQAATETNTAPAAGKRVRRTMADLYPEAWALVLADKAKAKAEKDALKEPRRRARRIGKWEKLMAKIRSEEEFTAFKAWVNDDYSIPTQQ